jgi:hypothetical protein
MKQRAKSEGGSPPPRRNGICLGSTAAASLRALTRTYWIKRLKIWEKSGIRCFPFDRARNDSIWFYLTRFYVGMATPITTSKSMRKEGRMRN